ncbi:bifunctional phosphoribosylaminoimidazolecarboxamide formyltransferase/IMP cyclohydrolase [Flavobacteriales bacterium]|nr:bifunctional phosphoribosylaminoimidazolecarboxamide formyltransferase/IMP cyclohydrolase [Flavobacteriales bacterium]
MNAPRHIQSALISVYHKEGLEPIVRELIRLGITIYSTGGTQVALEAMGAEVVPVESITDYPSILGGRVKTLHPKVFGGILNRRAFAPDVAHMEEYAIPAIDLVIVDLYPFEETVASGGSHAEIIEKIDIGGISLIRAAAKNFEDVVIVSNQSDYGSLVSLLQNGEGVTTREERKELAARAFRVSSHYDTRIHEWMIGGSDIAHLNLSEMQSTALRYGENPHQPGKFFGPLDKLFDQLHGKALSYNNLLDIDAAVQLMSEFQNDDPTFAVLKHNNACGLATRSTLLEAWNDALAGDPVSAFGGVLIGNRIVDKATAESMHDLFFEVVIAPGFDEEALVVLKQKKNRILLIQKPVDMPEIGVRSALNGYLVQSKDAQTEGIDDLKLATNEKANQEQLDDLIFAMKVTKHTRSNTIVFAKGRQLLGSGTGQTSRVDALKQAVVKANNFGFDLNGAVMASDAFFPFPDCVELADQAGIKAVIQPGGSIKDDLSVAYCDENGLSMYMTGVRHFRH